MPNNNFNPHIYIKKLKTILFFLFISLPFLLDAQQNTSMLFVEPEIHLGKIAKTNSFFPETKIQQRYRLNIGKYNTGNTSSWESFLNYPTSGITLEYAILGNNAVFGNSYSLLSFIEMRSGKKISKSINFHVGLGVSYFDTPFDPDSNRLNRAIGSHLTWSLQAFVYYNLYTSEQYIVRLGGGYLHSSNGHTRIPNFGLNSGAISISTAFLSPHPNLSFSEPYVHHKADNTIRYTFGYRQGFGFHVFGGTEYPLGGKNKPVYTSEISLGIVLNQYFRLYGGFAYRYYVNYYDYIVWNELDSYFSHPNWSSSNIYAFVATELLAGHVGLNFQVGINLAKPFYKEFDDLFQNSKILDYYLKSLFPTRMGLKLYLKKTQNHPKHNLYLGAHINANFGEADFSEISIGYLGNLN